MPVRFLPRKGGRTKPNLGAYIDLSHPLAPRTAFLFNEGAGLTTKSALMAGPPAPQAVATINSTTNVLWHPMGLQFDGNAASYMTTPGSAMSFGTMSIAAWVILGVTGTDREIVEATSDTLALRVTTANIPTAVVHNGAFFSAAGTGYPLILQKLHLMVMSFSPSNSVLRLFLDGVMVAETAASTGTLTALSTNLFFGKHPNLTTRCWSGVMSSVCFWDRALTKEEALWLYMEPYCFMQEPAPNRIWSIATAGPSLLFHPNPMRHMIVR